MSNTILCAVDINRPDEEQKVLERAAQLAELDGARLDVITVVPDFGASLVGAYFEEHHVSTAKDKASTLLSDMVSNALGAEKNKTIRHVVAVGSVYEKVLQTAELNKANLIVIGAHRPDFKDYLLGPNAARIVRHSSASVYVVR